MNYVLVDNRSKELNNVTTLEPPKQALRIQQTKTKIICCVEEMKEVRPNMSTLTPAKVALQASLQQAHHDQLDVNSQNTNKNVAILSGPPENINSEISFFIENSERFYESCNNGMNLASALKAYKNNQNHKMCCNLVECYIKIGKIAAAEAIIEKFRQQGPSFGLSKVNQVHVKLNKLIDLKDHVVQLIKNDQTEKCLTILDEAFKLAPSCTDLHFYKLRCQVCLGKFKDCWGSWHLLQR